jgi:hypothetical protein
MAGIGVTPAMAGGRCFGGDGPRAAFTCMDC